MAHFNNIALRRVSSLEVLASSESKKVAVMIDARRGNAFSAVYDVEAGYKTILEPQIRKVEDFIQEIGDIPLVTIDNANIKPNLLISSLVENVHTFSPNYLREWGE